MTKNKTACLLSEGQIQNMTSVDVVQYYFTNDVLLLGKLPEHFLDALNDAPSMADYLPIKFGDKILQKFSVQCKTCDNEIHPEYIHGNLNENGSYIEFKGFTYCDPCDNLTPLRFRINEQMRMHYFDENNIRIIDIENTLVKDNWFIKFLKSIS